MPMHQISLLHNIDNWVNNTSIYPMAYGCSKRTLVIVSFKWGSLPSPGHAYRLIYDCLTLVQNWIPAVCPPNNGISLKYQNRFP